MRKGKNTRKKQVFALSTAFILMVSALTGSSYFANKREAEYAARQRDDVLNGLTADTGSEGHSYNEADSGFADQVKTLTNENGLVVMATSESIGDTYGEVTSSISSGDLTLASFNSDEAAADAVQKLNDDDISSAVDSNGFTIMNDGGAGTVGTASKTNNSNAPVVALIDTGDSNADWSVNFTNEADSDENGHGTRMDQLIRNAAGGNVRILSLKAMKKDGTGSLSEVSAALQYAIDSGVDIINMSIAAEADENNTAVMKALVTQAYAKNIKIVAAAGNSSKDASDYLPACLDQVISVGAADNDGKLSAVSNYGANAYVKGKKYTSDAAAVFTGYLAGSASRTVSEHEDVLTDCSRPKENDESADALQTVNTAGANTASSYQNSTTANDVNVFQTQADYNNGTKLVYQKTNQTSYTPNVNNASKNTGVYLGGGSTAFSAKFSLNSFNGEQGNEICIIDNYEKAGGGISVKSRHISGVFHVNGSYITVTDPDVVQLNKVYNVTASAAAGQYVWLSVNGKIVDVKYVAGGVAMTPASVPVTLGANPPQTGTPYVGQPDGEQLDGTIYEAAVYQPGMQYYRCYDINALLHVTNNGNISSYFSSSDAASSQFKDYITDDKNDLMDYLDHNSFDAAANGGSGQYLKFDVYIRHNHPTFPNDKIVSAAVNSGTGWVKYLSDVADSSTWIHPNDEIFITNIRIQPGYKWKDNIEGNFYTGNYYSKHEFQNGTLESKRTNGVWKTNDSSLPGNGTGIYINAYQYGSTEAPSVADTATVYIEPRKYNVHFDINSSKDGNITPNYDQITLAKGSMSDQSLTYGTYGKLNKCGFTWEGHTFTGWNTKSDGTGKSYTDQQAGYLDVMAPTDDNQSVTLYAQWTRNKSTVSIDANGGTYSGKTPVTQLWGTSLTVSDPKPKNETAVINYDYTDNGYFSGVTWSDDQTAGVTSSAVSSNQDSVGLVFSKWQVMTKDKSTDVPDGNGSWGFIVNRNNYIFGAYNAVLQARYHHQTVVLPTPKKDGYTFLGWYTDENWKTKAGNAGDRYRPKKNITLYARFRPDSYKYSDEVEVTMQDPPSDKDEAYVKIKKTDKNGNVLTTVDGQEFVIGICTGNSWNEKNLVMTLKTNSGIYDSKGKLLIGPIDVRHDKNEGWWNVTDLLTAGQNYTAHEISAPAGYTLDTDKKFKCVATTASLAQARDAYNKAKANLEKATGVNASDATNNLKNAQAAYDKAKSAYDEARTERITIQFKDSYIIIPPGTKPVKTAPDKTKLGLVRFTLIDKTDGNKTVYTFKTEKDGKLPIDMYSHLVAGHQMEIKETAFAGFKAVDIEFYVPTNGDLKNAIPANIIDDAHTATLKLKKVDTDGNALSGAEFKLYSKDENGNYRECRHNNAGLFLLPNDDPDSEYAKGTAYTAVTGSDGIASFENINTRAFSTGPESTADSKSYYIKETKAPDGYSLMADYIKVTIPDEDKATVTYEVTVNESKTTMISLQSGGKGTKMYILIGSAMIAAAGVYLTMHRKMQKN